MYLRRKKTLSNTERHKSQSSPVTNSSKESDKNYNTTPYDTSYLHGEIKSKASSASPTKVARAERIQ